MSTGIAGSESIFSDAFYFVALLNRSDQHHAKVIAAARQLRENLLTTELVLMELADALAESACRRFVAPFIREFFEDPKVNVVSVTPDLFQRAPQVYDQRLDKGCTLTDCASFVVMRDEGLTEALTGDHHFEQAGYKALFINPP